MLDRGEPIKSKWDLIPEGIDVLMTHGGPRGILDRPYGRYEHVGCDDLLTRALQVRPKIHCFGHVHGDAGIKDFNGTTFINASSCGEDYKIRNEPIVLDV
jgi:Icc-related predicted phosphoesterase